MKVRCIDCENLCVIHPVTGERVEATKGFRQCGKYNYLSLTGKPSALVPDVVCHASQRPELEQARYDLGEEMIAFLSESIECGRFNRYERGRGPREIDEMSTHQALLDMQEKFLKLQESVFSWRQQQADRDDRFAKQIQALEETRHQEGRRDTNWQGWLAIALAALAAVVSLSCAAIQVAYSK